MFSNEPYVPLGIRPSPSENSITWNEIIPYVKAEFDSGITACIVKRGDEKQSFINFSDGSAKQAVFPERRISAENTEKLIESHKELEFLLPAEYEFHYRRNATKNCLWIMLSITKKSRKSNNAYQALAA